MEKLLVLNSKVDVLNQRKHSHFGFCLLFWSVQLLQVERVTTVFLGVTMQGGESQAVLELHLPVAAEMFSISPALPWLLSQIALLWQVQTVP